VDDLEAVIQPGSTQDQIIPTPVPTQEPSILVNEDDDEEEDDPYLQELARKARETKASQAENQSPEKSSHGQASNAEMQRQPTVQVVLMCPGEGHPPLGVKINLDQPFSTVRHAWCKNYHIPEDQWDSYIIAWRKMRIWDVVTPITLGYKSAFKGERIFEPGETEPVNAKKLRIIVDIMTEEVYDKFKKDSSNLGMYQAGMNNKGEESEDLDAKPSKDEGCKIWLKSKDRADHKIKVKPVRRFSLSKAKGSRILASRS
jgi:hypothetical protein